MITIREFNQKDAHTTARMVRLTLQTCNAAYYPKRVMRYLMSEYSEKKLIDNMGDKVIFVASFGTKIVGTARISKDGWIRGLFVHPNYQGKSIGTKLVHTMAKTIENQGFDALRCHSAINAIGFYKKLGFKKVKKVVFDKAGETYRMYLRL